MWPYWMLFLIPAVAGAVETGGVKPRRAASIDAAWVGVWIVLVLMIGFRHQVGGDWLAYLMFVLRARDAGLVETLSLGDPGFQFVNWMFAGWENGIYGVNLVSASIFATGLIIFCRNLPRPWLALTTAIPYLVVVVAMGYTRQGIALSLTMIGLVALSKGSTWKFFAWVAAAALFHKSAVLLLPVAALAASKSRYWTAAWIGLAGAMLYYLLVAEEVESLYANYVVADYQSQGALIRLFMNAVPAVVYLGLRKRFDFTDAERGLWTWFSILSLLFLVMYFVTTASTALDRVALYMLPLQAVVFSHLPDALATPSPSRAQQGGRLGKALRARPQDGQAYTYMILFYYAVVQFVWLNFATHAFAWLPYRFYPLDTGY